MRYCNCVREEDVSCGVSVCHVDMRLCEWDTHLCGRQLGTLLFWSALKVLAPKGTDCFLCVSVCVRQCHRGPDDYESLSQLPPVFTSVRTAVPDLSCTRTYL